MDKTANVKATEIAQEAREWLAGVLRVDLRDSDELTFTLTLTFIITSLSRRSRRRIMPLIWAIILGELRRSRSNVIRGVIIFLIRGGVSSRRR